jgi:hypothetical protein
MISATNQWPSFAFDASVLLLMHGELDQMPKTADTPEMRESLTEKIMRALLECSVPAGHA